MANQALVDYITQQRAAGVDKDKIVQALTENGWATSDILEATLAVFYAPAVSLPTSPPKTPIPQNIPVTGSDETTDAKRATVLLTGIFSLLAVFLTVLFQFSGVFPASWSWGTVIGGLAVFLVVMFLGARFVGVGAVIAVFVLTTALGGPYLVFGIPWLQHMAQQQTLKTGLDGTAVVTATNFDGFINYQSEFTITLQITPQSGVPFSANTMVFGAGSSQHAPYSVGTKVDVKYVPANHDVVIIGPAS